MKFCVFLDVKPEEINIFENFYSKLCRKNGFFVVHDFCGHGIGRIFHNDFVISYEWRKILFGMVFLNIAKLKLNIDGRKIF